jgi:hypothetical protein
LGEDHGVVCEVREKFGYVPNQAKESTDICGRLGYGPVQYALDLGLIGFDPALGYDVSQEIYLKLE